MTVDRIKVEGLSDLRRALKEAGGLQGELKHAHKAIADHVASGAASRAPVKTGALRASIKGMASQRDARIREGSAKVPYAGFIDFGGTIKPRGRPITRRYIRQGRTIYPALMSSWDYITDHYWQDIQKLLRKAGLL